MKGRLKLQMLMGIDRAAGDGSFDEAVPAFQCVIQTPGPGF